MNTKLKVTLVALPVAIVAFILGAGGPIGEQLWRTIWPWEQAAATVPTGIPLVALMVYGAIDAIAFGLAVAFLAFGWPYVKRASAGRNVQAAGAFWAIAWLFGSWWVHTNLHMVNGENYAGLAIIEYTFHATLIFAAAWLAVWLIKRVQDGTLGTGTADPTAKPTGPK